MADKADEAQQQEARVDKKPAEKPRTITLVSSYNSLKLEQIKQIYDYTKFHVGLYATLLTGLLALVTFGFGDELNDLYLFDLLAAKSILYVIAVLFLVAGVSGAIVASSIVYTDWNECFGGEEVDFMDGTWKWKIFKPRLSDADGWPKGGILSLSKWATFEHWAFWLGIAIAVFSIVAIAQYGGPLNKRSIEEAVARFAREVHAPEGRLSAGDAKLPERFDISPAVKRVKLVETGVALVEGENTFRDSAPRENAAAWSGKGHFVAILSGGGENWSVKSWGTVLK
ncbi:MAG TPA: hypothetical protein VGX48_07660 [Pyrinomonadaceae bacterium]|jgi:hypothetical protein|nr:hypothetical protein [Pyrinomonadaceae bacterium]